MATSITRNIEQERKSHFLSIPCDIREFSDETKPFSMQLRLRGGGEGFQPPVQFRVHGFNGESFSPPPLAFSHLQSDWHIQFGTRGSHSAGTIIASIPHLLAKTATQNVLNKVSQSRREPEIGNWLRVLSR